MSGQIPDEVRYQGCRHAVTAVEGAGLFDPADHGMRPGPLSTACWRGFHCCYLIQRDQLVLESVEMGRPENMAIAAELFGIAASVASADAVHSGALVYRQLASPVTFTGRLLLGADPVQLGYLNMGFRPAWLYRGCTRSPSTRDG